MSKYMMLSFERRKGEKKGEIDLRQLDLPDDEVIELLPEKALADMETSEGVVEGVICRARFRKRAVVYHSELGLGSERGHHIVQVGRLGVGSLLLIRSMHLRSLAPADVLEAPDCTAAGALGGPVVPTG
jgi:hypothetical protein